MLWIFILLDSTIFLPIINFFDPDCGQSDKKALSWAHIDREIDIAQLCLEDDFYWHGWGVNWMPDLSGTQVFALAFPWQWYNGNFRSQIPPDFEGIILLGNECDEYKQCNMSNTELATMIKEVISYCPGCTFSFPMYSPHDNDGHFSNSFWQEAKAVGIPSDKFQVGSLHIYNIGDMAYESLTTRVDAYYQNFLIPNGFGDLPTWITELGWYSYQDCRNLSYMDNYMSRWLEEAERDDRVEKYFGYTTFTDEQLPCSFSPFWFGDGQLSEYGELFKEAG